PGGQQLLHLRGLDRPLEDHAPRAEIARLLRADGFLADIRIAELEHARAALRTGAERRLSGEVGHLAVFERIRIAEVEDNLVRVVQPELRRKGPAQLAAESFERADLAVLDE